MASAGAAAYTGVWGGAPIGAQGPSVAREKIFAPFAFYFLDMIFQSKIVRTAPGSTVYATDRISNCELECNRESVNSEKNLPLLVLSLDTLVPR